MAIVDLKPKQGNVDVVVEVIEKEHLEKSTAYATLLNPVIGYDAAAACVKEAVATGKTLREVVLAQKLLTPKEFDRATKR